MRRLTTDEFILKCVEVHGDNYLYDRCEYVNIRTKVTVGCIKHGYFDILPTNHLHAKQGCSNCSNEKHRFDYLIESDIEFLKELHNHYYEYKSIVTKGRIDIKCPKHGWFNQYYYNHVRGSGCPTCNISKGEKFISNYLLNMGVSFETEKTFDDCLSPKGNKLKFDFYLEDSNVCIEYDGIQHYKSIEYFGGDVYFEYLQKCDNIKNEYCSNNGIKIFRIPYYYDIKGSLEEIDF